MKTTFKLFLILISLNVVSAYGQTEDVKSHRIGFGINLLNMKELRFTGERFYSNFFYVPVDIKDKFRLEPSFAFQFREKDEIIAAGLGLFRISDKRPFSLYYGLRTTIYDFHIYEFSPTIGGEYYLGQRFSLSAELNATTYLSNLELAVLGVDSHTALMVRYYFN